MISRKLSITIICIGDYIPTWFQFIDAYILHQLNLCSHSVDRFLHNNKIQKKDT